MNRCRYIEKFELKLFSSSSVMCIKYLVFVILIQIVFTEGIEKDLKDTGISFPEGKQHKGLFVKNELVGEEVEMLMEDFATGYSTDIDYKIYHSAIVHLCQQVKQNVALIVDSSCTADETVKLLSELKMAKKITHCYQINIEDYDLYMMDRFLLENDVLLLVLFLPWYILYDLLVKMAHYRMDHLTYVTIDMDPVVLNQLRSDRLFLKISNLVSASSTDPLLENRLLLRKLRSNNPSCFLMPQKEPSMQENIVLSCNENPVKSIRVVTLLHMRFVYSIPGHVFRNGKCDPIGLPCKIPNKHSKGSKTKWSWHCCNGVYIEILEKIINAFKIAVELYLVEDGGWGSLNNGTWNGMIHDVIIGKADLALAQLNVSPERLDVVDFTQPVTTQRDYLGIVIRKRNRMKSAFDWSSIQTITGISFIALLLITALVLVVIYLLENIGYKCNYNERYPFRDSFSYINGLLFQRDLGAVLPRRWPGRFVSNVFACGTTVLVGLLTAQMTATNIAEEELRFEGLRDKKLQNPLYIVGVKGNDHYESVVLRLNLKAKKVRIPRMSEGIESVRNKSIDAYVWQSLEMQYFMGTKKQYRDELFLYNEKISGCSDVAFAMQKGSRIGTVISKFILHMTESGDLQRTLDGWGLQNKPLKTQSMIFHQYPLEYGLSLVLLLGCTAVVCVFLVMLEHRLMHFKIKDQSEEIKN